MTDIDALKKEKKYIRTVRIVLFGRVIVKLCLYGGSIYLLITVVLPWLREFLKANGVKGL